VLVGIESIFNVGGGECHFHSLILFVLIKSWSIVYRLVILSCLGPIEQVYQGPEERVILVMLHHRDSPVFPSSEFDGGWTCWGPGPFCLHPHPLKGGFFIFNNFTKETHGLPYLFSACLVSSALAGGTIFLPG